MNRILAILDLDETLIYSTPTPLGRPADFRVASYHTYRRPHLEAFLAAVFEWFDVAVWTSSGEIYAREIVDAIFGPRAAELKLVWSSARCTRRFNHETWREDSIKDLRKVKRAGFALDRVLAIDDSPEKFCRHYGNHLVVRPFLGDPEDSHLRELLPFLDWIREQPGVRGIEKRLALRHRPD